jgi:SAM-dependent methyltransferase
VTLERPEAFDQRHEYGNFEANLRFLEEAGPLPARARLLEIGSGKGRLLHALRARGYEAFGVEPNLELIAEGRRLYGALPVQPVRGTALPFANGSFDAVLSFDVFEHIADSDAHLHEVARVLKPGGQYLLQTPNKWTNVLFETIRWRSFTAWRADHCALHSYRQLQRRFRRHGFATTFFRIPVVTEFFRWKVRRYLGAPGLALLAVLNPDRLPDSLRTNFFLKAQLGTGPDDARSEGRAHEPTR